MAGSKKRSSRKRGSKSVAGTKRSRPASSASTLPVLPLRWPLEMIALAEELIPRSDDEVEAFKAEVKRHIGWSDETFRKRPYSDGVVGVGFGAKLTRGQVVGLECVRVYVRKKQPRSRLRNPVPAKINGIQTDVIEAPNLMAQAVMCGVSAAHYKVTAGTLGCLVTKGGVRYALSNNHVFANVNVASSGDSILQPSPLDGGKPPALARLSEFKDIDFTGTNLIDAAIARLYDPAAVDPQIRLIGRIDGNLIPPQTGLQVKKTGRTTDLTSGRVEGTSEDMKVGYPGNREARFVKQILIHAPSGAFSLPGDSGSLVVGAEGNHTFALLFAGGKDKEGVQFTLASPMAEVLRAFGVTVVS